MRYPGKIVAALMVIALWVMPLSAAMLCSGGMDPTTDCGQCFRGMATMAESGMNATMTMGTIDLAKVSSPSCCKFAPDRPSVQNLAREVQNPVILIALQSNVSTFAAVPHQLTSSRLQSVLCTFLI
jgi:hypothetical protein